MRTGPVLLETVTLVKIELQNEIAVAPVARTWPFTLLRLTHNAPPACTVMPPLRVPPSMHTDCPAFTSRSVFRVVVMQDEVNLTAKDLVTAGAANQLALPPCVASTLQVPPPTTVTLSPTTVHVLA